MTQIYIDIHTHQHHSSETERFDVFNLILNADPDDHYLPPVTAGLHPWHINESDPFKGISILQELLRDHEILAVGECGMDKVISVPLNVQQDVFQKQVSLAKEYGKPLIIHCVRAFDEVQQVLKSENFTGHIIFHGFNKNRELAEQLLKKGYYLSFGSSILTGKLDETLVATPLEQLFLETDDAHADIRELYAYAAQLKKISINELKENIIRNYQLVFE
nr:TatD family hydrolase [uncultured Sphingobacterium sp.]